jgi:hypothetical protein
MRARRDVRRDEVALWSDCTKCFRISFSKILTGNAGAPAGRNLGAWSATDERGTPPASNGDGLPCRSTGLFPPLSGVNMLKHSMPAEAPGAVTERVADSGRLHLDPVTVDEGDGAQFRAALARHARASGRAEALPQTAQRMALGEQMLGRAASLAEEMKGDQQYVSRLLETATRTGDSMHLMKAMMAMNDYQTRVQFVSKVVSKATSSLDQLTKLQ